MIRIIRNYITGSGDSWPHATGNLLEWMQENAPDIADKRVMVEINGHPLVDTSVTPDPDRKCDIDLTDADNVIIRVLPEGLEPITIGILAVSAALSVASVLLIPEPETPNRVGENKSSPNNRLNASRNEFRPRQAIPDISGIVNSFPDFIQPSFLEYENNTPVYREWFCIGLREFEHVRAWRSGETPIESLPQSNATVYPPGSHPALIDLRQSVTEAENQFVPAVQDPSRYRTVTGGTLNFAGDSVIDVVDEQIIIDLSIFAGSEIRVQGDYFDINFNENRSINEVFEVVSVSGSEITLSGIVVQGSEGSWDGAISSQALEPNTPWFTLPGSAAEEIVFNMEFPQGLSGADGTEITVIMALQYQELDANGDPVGSQFSTNESITANTPSPQYRTYKYDVAPGSYRARVINLSSYDSGAGAKQRIVLNSIYSGREYSTANFGDIQILNVVRRAPAGSSPSRGDKINGLVNGKLPIFDPAAGAFGALASTRSFAQFVMYLHSVRGNGALKKIDYEALFDIEQSMPEDLARFDFTVDDSDIGLKERIATACNAARVRAYTIGGDYLTFARDESSPVNQALFGRRDIAPNSMKETWLPHRTTDYDSVQIEYVNPLTNAPAYERRRINSSGVIENGEGSRIKKMELAGCRTVSQAINRADYEIRKMRYQRRRLNFTALRYAQDVIPGMRVAVESLNDKEVFGGEILGVNGDIYSTSEAFAPETGKDYYVYITDEQGALSNMVLATAVNGDKMAFQAAGLTAFVADGYEVQLGSRYVIAEAQDHERQSWTVVSRGRADEFGRVSLELVNYDERVYEAD